MVVTVVYFGFQTLLLFLVLICYCLRLFFTDPRFFSANILIFMTEEAPFLDLGGRWLFLVLKIGSVFSGTAFSMIQNILVYAFHADFCCYYFLLCLFKFGILIRSRPFYFEEE